MRLPSTLLFPLLLLLGSCQLFGADLHSHAAIQEAARAHILAQYPKEREGIRVEVSRLDKRLRLSRCAIPLKTFSPPGRKGIGRQTVGVRCEDGEPWSLYVPVRVEITRQILVASRELRQGAIIAKGDFRLEERPTSGLHRGYFEDPERVIGATLQRLLHRNEVVTPGQVRLSRIVKRGSHVTILGKVGPIKVRMGGKALSDGSIGERIKVMNSSSKRQIEATVRAPGIVEVSL